MANPYEQFDKKAQTNPYAKFDKEENPYAKFDKETTSVGEDIAIGWGDVYKTAMDANEVAAAGLMGLAEAHPLIPSALTDKSTDTFRQLQEDTASQKTAVDRWANPEDKEQTFGGKVIGTLGSLPGQIAAMPLSPAQTGKEFIDAGESVERAQEAALIDTGGNVIGFALPGALGGRLATKVATGAGIGAGQDYAVRTALSDIAQTEEGKKKFAPTAESTALAGIVGGAVGGLAPTTHAKRSEPSKVEADVEASAAQAEPLGEASRGSERMIQDYLVQNDKDISRAEYKLKQIEQDLKEKQFDSPEQAEQYKQAKTEEYQQHSREIAELQEGRKQAETYLKGEEVPAAVSPREEIPSSLPSRQQGTTFAEAKAWKESDEGKAWEKDLLDKAQKVEEEGKLTSSEQFQKTLLKNNPNSIKDYLNDPDFGTAQLAYKVQDALDLWTSMQNQQDKVGIRITESRLDDAINELIKYTNRGESIALAPLQQMSEGEFVDLSTVPTAELETRINDLDITSEAGRIEFESIAQEMASRMPAPEKRAVVNGGSEAIRTAVNDWLVKTGLDKEDIEINLDSTDTTRLMGTQLGTATVHGSDLGEVNVRGADFIQQRMDELGPKASRWMRNLTTEQEAKFKEAWTAAHELGHIMLAKLLQNKLYSDSLGLGKLIKDYNAWLSKHKTQGSLAIARAEGNLFGKPSKQDYYLDFPEFFAQRVARELVLGKSAPKRDAISRFVSDLRTMFSEIMQKMRLPYFKENFVDEFIQGVIAKNRQSLEETGKTLWEVDATTVSMYDAWTWQFDHLMKKPEDGYVSGMGDMQRKSGIQAAVHHIENAEAVIAKQLAVPDINPMGSKGVGKFASGLVNKAGNWLFGIQQKAQLYKNSPMVKYASDVILNGLHVQTMRQMELLAGKTDRTAWDGKARIGVSLKKVEDGDSPSIIFDKSSNEDFYAVHQILEKGIGKYSYEESLAMFGANLTEGQKKLYNTTVKMYARMYEMAAGLEKTLGKKGIIPNMKGWYPAMRKGEFTVNFRIEGLKRVAGRDEMGRAVMTDLVHSQSFRTEGEARAFIEHFEKQSPEFKGRLQHGGVEKAADPEMVNSIADFHRAYQEQRAKLDLELSGDPALAPKWLKEEINKFGGDPQKMLDGRMQKMVDMYIARGGTLGGHHRLRTNVSGAMGSEMFTNPQTAGKAFRDANFKAVDEYTNMMMKMEIQEKLDLMLSKEELKQSHPNTLEVVQLMRDYALNEVKSPMEMKGFKASVDAVWEQLWSKTALSKMKVFGAEKYMDAPVVDLALGKMGHFFYIHALMSRPAFWAAQGVQFLWAGRTMVKDGVGPVGAMTHAGKGFWQVLKPDKEFLDALFEVSQTSHTFSPQFIQDLNKHGIGDFMKEGGTGKLLFDLVTGEKQSTMADTFSRLMTFGMVYEHFKSKGLKGSELAQEAARATDENMVQYSRQYKAPAFQKLGVVGDLVSPLQTFSQAAMGNLVSDVGAILQAPGGKAKLQASLPFMATVAITTLMAGAIGAPLVAEYEALRLLINYLSEKLGGKELLPSVVDAVLAGDNTFANRTLSHGLISSSTMAATGGEGLDIAASNRWQPIWGGMLIGEKTFMESVPVINFWLDRAGNVTDIVKHGTGISELSDAERRNSALGIVPGMYKGAVDDLIFGAREREFVPDMKGDATVPQTDTERAAKYLGTSTVASSTEKLRQRRTKEQEMRTQEKVDKQFELLADAVIKGNQFKVQSISKELADKYQIDVDQQESRLRREITNRKVSAHTRQFVGGSGTSSTQQQKRAKYWQETYDVSPSLENE